MSLCFHTPLFTQWVTWQQGVHGSPDLRSPWFYNQSALIYKEIANKYFRHLTNQKNDE